MSLLRTASEASHSHPGAANRLGQTRSQPAKTNTAPTAAPKQQSHQILPTSHVRLFVTNLRLLDFDLLDDWPEITVQTFSAKNADQKQRIGAAEWALFRLFEVWDPTETAQKLRPFFPPLEPLQSLNLRAALYRCLNDLKKNGVLGRESVLRKTMLDECKGDRFYEIIALFSAAVLKKVVADTTAKTTNVAVARKLATASTLTSHDQSSLLPLAIAHKAALVNVLRLKDEKRARVLEFQAALDSKASDIDKRIRKCADTPRARQPAVVQREADAVKKQLADNWVGNQKWLEVILHGDQSQAGDAFLSKRFDKVWHMVEQGRHLADAAPDAGLLENLQSRVHQQQTRLQKWKSFHEQMRNDNAKSVVKAQQAAISVRTLKFDDHIKHQLPPVGQAEFEANKVQRPALRSIYMDILSDMDAKLSRVAQSRSQATLTTLPRRRRSSSSAPRSLPRTRNLSVSKVTTRAPPSSALHAEPKSLISEPKMLVKEQKALYEGLAAGNSLPPLQRRTTAKAVPVYPGRNNDLRVAASASPATSSPALRPVQLPTESDSISTPLSPDDSPEPSQPTSISELSASQQSLELPDLKPEEALADMIINAIGDATPSPVKKAQPRMSMSLVDRTRMTLSRTPSFDPVLESPDTMPTAPSTVLPLPREDQPDNLTTLLERTRLSMAAMSNRPRTSVVSAYGSTRRLKRESTTATQRGSKPFEITEEGQSGTRTPQEDLLSPDIDYDRVFRSRPRIATSPIFSPEKYPGHDEDAEKDCYEEEITGIDLDDVDRSDDDTDGFTQNLANSPTLDKDDMAYKFIRVPRASPRLAELVTKYRAMKLHALETDPASLGAKHDIEAALPFTTGNTTDNQDPIMDLMDNKWVGLATIRGPMKYEDYYVNPDMGLPVPAVPEAERRWHIYDLYTLPEHRGQGLARNMVKECVAIAVESTASQCADNEATACPDGLEVNAARIRLFMNPKHAWLLTMYESFGFVAAGKATLEEGFRANVLDESIPANTRETKDLVDMWHTRIGLAMEQVVKLE
ncbi:hypothetical protein E8E13_007805 [Curvularia kusanoi]|uniref:N-acetyltransferase domain-containing protein n=1 Tax=Curvularia kusanoi TaxID=90978 RepID=A0A9P4TBR8_CURKU|nr:hypothetical protein E8E13_007805 [Curvularia kusanoi]